MSKKFGEYLRELRESRKLTLREVEKLAKISNAYLSQIEGGKRGVPNIRILTRLSEAYGVPLNDIVRAAEEETQSGSVDVEVTSPNTDFVSRGYEKLSEEGKRSLNDFLQHLIDKEKKNQNDQED